MILGCSFDPTADNKAFKEKFEFPYDLLTDADKQMSIAYGAATADSERPTRISVLIGPDGKIKKRFDTVTPADHPDEVLGCL